MIVQNRPSSRCISQNSCKQQTQTCQSSGASWSTRPAVYLNLMEPSSLTNTGSGSYEVRATNNGTVQTDPGTWGTYHTRALYVLHLRTSTTPETFWRTMGPIQRHLLSVSVHTHAGHLLVRPHVDLGYRSPRRLQKAISET